LFSHLPGFLARLLFLPGLKNVESNPSLCPREPMGVKGTVIFLSWCDPPSTEKHDYLRKVLKMLFWSWLKLTWE
jgi:hypothetical protein